MTNTIRVALPSYNALTDTDPDHFALYADEDWVLIKEQSRGSVSVASIDSEVVTHNLGYIPFYMVYVEHDGVSEWIHGYSIYATFNVYVTTTQIVFINNSGDTVTFKYYLFYDKQV